MEENAIVVHQNPGPIEMLPADAIQEQFKRLQNFVKSQMRDGTDFGIIPGTKKPSLLKPGAEKLLNLHALSCKLEIVTSETVVNWKDGFFNYCYRATVFNPRTGAVLATSDGSCNSLEDGFTKQIEQYGKLAANFVNTIQKRSQKRAMVGATLMATRASDIFTQDLEDHSDTAGSAQEPKSDLPQADKISEAQGKRFYAICKGAGKTDDEIKAYLKSSHGLTSTRDIIRPIYDEVCQWGAEKKS